MSDPEVIRESILAIMAMAHRHRVNKNKLVTLQAQEFLIELMRFWGTSRGVGLAIRYDARDALNVLKQFQDPYAMDWNILALPPRKSTLSTDIMYEDGALGSCIVADPEFPACQTHLAQACVPAVCHRPFRKCLVNADTRAYNRVNEDSFETNRSVVCHIASLCSIIAALPCALSRL